MICIDKWTQLGIDIINERRWTDVVYIPVAATRVERPELGQEAMRRDYTIDRNRGCKAQQLLS
jgi:predicted site-specific integrase-resolvase